MNLAEYISGITFRCVQPQEKRPKWYYPLSKIAAPFGVHLDALNARLPEEEKAMRRRLRDVLAVPRMSTFAIGAIINKAVGLMPPEQAFVNVGVWNGFTLLAGMAGNETKRCVGIDNFSGHGNPREAFLRRFEARKGQRQVFFEMDYREYFATVHEGPIGMYIYDGFHSYEDQLHGLEIAEPFFAERCVVLVDDVNWRSARQGTLDFLARSRRRYRVLLDCPTHRNHHPTFWNGVMVLQRDDRD